MIAEIPILQYHLKWLLLMSIYTNLKKRSYDYKDDLHCGMCLDVCILREKWRGGVFEPVEPPIEKPEEPEKPTTPPSIEDLRTIKINDEI